ncbi:MAG TPA: RHS repeat-associated core domain-containing protein [Verrucomicrobiae bacterium]|nr:RHS repeat-associated core domain-containing protein [Verrucomicrobiae bacterium]
MTAINPSTANLQLDYDADGSVATDGVYDYTYDDRERLTQVNLKASSVLLQTNLYDDRGLRLRLTDMVRNRTTAYFRGPDGLVLSEFAMLFGSGLEPHWKKDYVYALGRHIAAVENTEPQEPAGVTSSASPPGSAAAVTLSWLPVSASDLYAYRVYRATGSSSATYSLISTGTAASFTDTTGLPGTGYFFKLTTIDLAGIESRETAPRKITPGDGTAPGAASNLVATAYSHPLLTWTGSPDSDGDLAGYRVFRSAGGGTLTQLGSDLPPGSVSYMDTTAVPEAVYLYEVRAFDTAGNESTGNPSAPLTVPPDPEGGGGGSNCGDHCMPGIGSLVLPRCEGAPGDPSGAVEGFCLAGEAGDELADHTGVEADYRFVFYHVDHLGTPRILTDEMGAVVSEHSLYPFGEEVPGPYSIADSTNTHWFTGHERDLGVDGDYVLARYYRSSIARFTSSDPDPSARFRPPSASNLLSYTRNSPVSSVDPDGNLDFTLWDQASFLALVQVRQLAIHGRYCGGGYTGGAWGGASYASSATDSIDSACKTHDKSYEACQRSADPDCYLKADFRLVVELQRTEDDRRLDFWAHVYREMAKLVFTSKLFLFSTDETLVEAANCVSRPWECEPRLELCKHCGI